MGLFCGSSPFSIDSFINWTQFFLCLQVGWGRGICSERWRERWNRVVRHPTCVMICSDPVPLFPFPHDDLTFCLPCRSNNMHLSCRNSYGQVSTKSWVQYNTAHYLDSSSHGLSPSWLVLISRSQAKYHWHSPPALELDRLYVGLFVPLLHHPQLLSSSSSEIAMFTFLSPVCFIFGT